MPYMIRNGVLYHSDEELYHYGVKGMKWGKRKARDNDPVYQKKQAYKQAKKDYNKSFRKANSDLNRLRAISPLKKHRLKADALWDDAGDKAEASRKAKHDYKQAKLSSKIDKQRGIVDSWKDSTPVKDKKGRTVLSKDDIRDIHDSALKKLNKLEYKRAIEEKRFQINEGASAVGKLYNMVTKADKYQAQIEYDMEKRAKVNKNWRT